MVAPAQVPSREKAAKTRPAESDLKGNSGTRSTNEKRMTTDILSRGASGARTYPVRDDLSQQA